MKNLILVLVLASGAAIADAESRKGRADDCWADWKALNHELYMMGHDARQTSEGHAVARRIWTKREKCERLEKEASPKFVGPTPKEEK